MKIRWWQYILILVFIGIITFSFYLEWCGLKVVIEFKNLGWKLFIFQYFYYFAEVFLISLLIVYSQNAFDSFFRTKHIPWGGVVLGLTWGLLHVFTQENLFTGIFLCIASILFGSFYLLTNRNYLKTILILFIAFII